MLPPRGLGDGETKELGGGGVFATLREEAFGEMSACMCLNDLRLKVESVGSGGSGGSDGTEALDDSTGRVGFVGFDFVRSRAQLRSPFEVDFDVAAELSFCIGEA